MGPRPERAAALLLLLCAACGHVQAEAREGDFLLVTIDTLRADFVSAYGAPLESTPHLDALARAGKRAAAEVELVTRLETELETWGASVQIGVEDRETDEETLRALKALGC